MDESSNCDSSDVFPEDAGCEKQGLLLTLGENAILPGRLERERAMMHCSRSSGPSNVASSTSASSGELTDGPQVKEEWDIEGGNGGDAGPYLLGEFPVDDKEMNLQVLYVLFCLSSLALFHFIHQPLCCCDAYQRRPIYHQLHS